MCINLYTCQQRLAYAKRLQQLQQAVVIKDNIHLTYKYKNQNKAIANAHSLQDKIIKSIVDNAVSGNADSIKNIDSQVEKLLTTTLENERKRIHNKKDHYIDNAVEQNSAKYSKILTNRINQEAFKLESKIESEIRSGIHKKLTEAETRQELLNKYGDTGKARIKNIIRDSIHTNESNISFIDALSKGYNYKVWMNGRGKGKTRPWHKANIITSVPIEEYFDIYGSYHAQLMYPGDLYGGAENVANCRCWLRYTNKVPENLKKKTTFNVNPSYQNIWDKTKNKIPLKENTRIIRNIEGKFVDLKDKFLSKIRKLSINYNKKSLFSRYNEKHSANSLKSKIMSDLLQKPKKKSFFNRMYTFLKNTLKNDLNKKSLTENKIPLSKKYKQVEIVQNDRFMSFDDAQKLYDLLPYEIKKYITTINLNPPTFTKTGKPILGSVNRCSPNVLNLYKTSFILSWEGYVETIYHESGHILDHSYFNKIYGISNSQLWEKAVKYDNIKYGIDNSNNEEYNIKWVSPYAKFKGLEYKKNNQNDRIYAEDFADSVRLFLKDKEQFMENFEGRYKVLKLLIG